MLPIISLVNEKARNPKKALSKRFKKIGTPSYIFLTFPNKLQLFPRPDCMFPLKKAFEIKKSPYWAFFKGFLKSSNFFPWKESLLKSPEKKLKSKGEKSPVKRKQALRKPHLPPLSSIPISDAGPPCTRAGHQDAWQRNVVSHGMVPRRSYPIVRP